MSTPPYLAAAPPLAFAHRGGATVEANVGIENSLAAFRHAFDLGYRYFETDVRCTRDGIPFACHDERLDRLSGHDLAIADVDSSELADMSLGDREPIVRLSELLGAFPEAWFNIDLKSDDAVEPTLALLQEMNVLERVCLASFSHTRLRRIRRLAPGVVTSASMREVALMVLGLPVPRAPMIFQVPVRHGPFPVITRRFLKRAHQHGKFVHVWTIDDPTQMHQLLDLGVDGLMTDRTDLLKDVLTSRGQWKETP